MSIVNPPLYDTPIFNPSNYNSQTSTSGIEMMEPATQNGITYYDNNKLNTASNVVISSSNIGIGTSTPTEKLSVFSSDNTKDVIVSINTNQNQKASILRLQNTFDLQNKTQAGNSVLQFCNGKSGSLIRNNFFIGYDTQYTDNYLNQPLTIGAMGDNSFGSPDASGTKTNIMRFFQNGVTILGPLVENQINAHFNVKSINSNADVACFYNTANVPIVIDKNSNLGLNVEFPTERLDVNGNTKISGNARVTGNLSVGTSTPSAKLHVVQTDATDCIRVDDRTSDTTYFRIDENGVAIFQQPDTPPTQTYQNVIRVLSATGGNSLRLNVGSNGFGLIDILDGAGNVNCVLTGNNASNATNFFTRNVAIGTITAMAQLSIVGSAANYDNTITDDTGLGMIGMFKEISFAGKNLPWYMGVGDAGSETSRFVLLSSDSGSGNKPVIHMGFHRIAERLQIKGTIYMNATNQAMKIPVVPNSSLADIGNAPGFMLYNTTSQTISINDGSNWRNLTCANNQYLTNLFYTTPKSVSLPASGKRRIDLGSGQALNSVGSSNWVAEGQYASFKYTGATTANIAKVTIDFYQSCEMSNHTINFSILRNGTWSGTSYTSGATELPQTITSFPASNSYQNCSITFLINGLTQNDVFNLGYSLASGSADKLFYIGQLKITCDVSI
jgi:hypothetical protein